MKKKGKSGITLIALVITIVVLLILVAITINLLMGDNSIFETAREAKFKDKMAGYRDIANIWVSSKLIETQSAEMNSYNVGESLINYIDFVGQDLVDIAKEDVDPDIAKVITQIEKEDEEKVVIYKGEMYYVKIGNSKKVQKEAKWCTDINIKILEMQKPIGIVRIDGSYQLVDGVWMCTPYLTEGFDKLHTRYVNEITSNGESVMTPGTFIFNRPDENWYSYGKNKWANIVTEDNGNETYFTWIPRYCYKILDGQKTDVKLIDIDNSWRNPDVKYLDEDGNEIEGVKPTPWSELEKEGYIIPEAFSTTDLEGNKVQLKGFWAVKYRVGNSLKSADGGAVISYQMQTAGGTIKIRDITINKSSVTYTSTPITKYIISLNGYTKFTLEGSDIDNIESESFSFDKKNLKPGDNVFNITGLNEKGEMVGSYTTTYGVSVYNPPDLGQELTSGGFNKDTTFYVTYDAKGNEHSYIPISQPAPSGWYDYESAQWANIVVRNNGAETYYTWIPRYQYQINSAAKNTKVKFIQGTGTTADSGYAIPEAFSITDLEGNKVELKGFWAMKYRAGNATTELLDTNVISGLNYIKVNGIMGTAVAEGQKYNYYIDGQLKETKTSASDTVTFSDLQPGKTYTILIEVRNEADSLVGTIVKQVKQVKITVANAPDLGKDLALSEGKTGAFNKEKTFYVTFDEKGEPVKGESINNAPPADWYDYANQKWANILVENNNAKTYYTWIPRYKYTIDSVNKKTNVEFIKDTDGTAGTTTEDGWTIPEAFSFTDLEGNKVQLKGFWAMKYRVGE